MSEQTDRTTKSRIDLELTDRQRWICRRVVGDHVLDAGCGGGEVTAALAGEGRHVLAIDSARAAVDATQALLDRYEQPASQAAVIRASVADMPADAASIDTVVLGELLTEVADPVPVLRESARVLRPGGRLVVTCAYGSGTADRRAVLLGELIEVVGQYFTLRDAVLVDGSVGLVADRAVPPELPEEGLMRALAVAERRLTELERVAADRTAERDRASVALAEAEQAQAELPIARRRAQSLEEELARLREDSAAQRDDAAAQRQALEQQLERLTEESAKQRAMLQAQLERVADEFAAQRAALQAQVEEAERSAAADREGIEERLVALVAGNTDAQRASFEQLLQRVATEAATALHDSRRSAEEHLAAAERMLATVRADAAEHASGLREELAELGGRAQAAQQRYDTELAEAETLIGALRDERDDLRARLSAATSRADVVGAELDEVRGRLVAAETAAAELRGRAELVARLEARAALLAEQLGERDRRLEGADTAQRELAERLATAEERVAATEQAHAAVADALIDERERANRERGERDHRREALEDLLDELRTRASILDGEVAAARAEAEHARTQQHAVDAALTQMREAMEAHLSRQGELADRQQHWSERSLELQEEREQLRRELDRAASTVESHVAAARKAESERVELAKELRRAQDRLKAERAERARLESSRSIRLVRGMWRVRGRITPGRRARPELPPGEDT